MKHKIFKLQSGFTLIEVLVAMALGVFLSAGVIQIFIANKQTYNMQEALSRVQENARFSTDFLGYEIRHAGFLGCLSKGVDFHTDIDVSKYSDSEVVEAFSFTGSDGLQGYDGITSLSSGDDLYDLGIRVGTAAGNLLSGTDALVLRGVKACSGGEVVVVGSAASTAQVKIVNATTCDIKQNDPVVISDCQNADLFGVSNNPQSGGGSADTLAHGSNRNLTPKLSKTYGPDAAIYKYRMAALYIGQGAFGQPSLYRLRLAGSSLVREELVEGVEDMQILYGEDTDGDGLANYYRSASGTNITDMGEVVSIRVSLLLQTLNDRVASKPVAYSYNGATSVMPADRRIRRVVTFTVALRNRLS